MKSSEIYSHLWGTGELRALFDDRGRIQAWLDILAALAAAQAELELIPAAAATEIVNRSRVELLDLAYVLRETRATSHSTLGLIRGMQRVLSPEAGEWFCYGATVQDISDTWTALVMREVGRVVYRDLRTIEGSLLALARRYRNTPTSGRTHGQPGLPVSFGFKAAVWAAEVRRHLERLKEGRSRWLVGQLGGAAGTGSFWGEKVIPLQRSFCARLGLGVPEISWITARDRVAEFAWVLAMVAHTLAKIGNEIVQLQRPEINELSEPFELGQVGSITMPHKRNPERSEHLVTLARLVRADVAVLLESMIVEHERDGRSWKAEWAAFPETCLLTGTALAISCELLKGLQVHPESMWHNLEANRGYLFSERVMTALAAKVGKQSAHLAVYRAAMSGQERGLSFRAALASSHEVTKWLTPDQLDRLFEIDLDPGPNLVDHVLAEAERSRRAETDAWA